MIGPMLIAWLIALVCAQAGQPTLDSAQRQIEARDWRAAESTLLGVLGVDSGSFRAMYGLACVRAQLGDIGGASDALLDAISLGFSDFWDMQREPLLAALHDHTTWKSVMTGWGALLDARGRTDMLSAKKALGKAYRTAQDEAKRISYVHAHKDAPFAQVEEDLAAIDRWAREALFGDALDGGGDKPDPWVTLVLPSPEDFVVLVGAPNVGGYYDHDAKRLISMDLGPSLAHEYLHVLHWRVMTRAGQRHPDWVMEALGALIEDVDLTVEGALNPAPSWRTNIAKRRLAMGRLMGWSELFTLDRARFRGAGAGAPYAQARAVALFLYGKGALADWFSAYMRTFEVDPTGAAAIEEALGGSIDAIEADFRAWLDALAWAPEEPIAGSAWLGVDLGLGRGDGARVDWLPAGSPARKAGLRMGDVLVRIDGRRVWTRQDALRIVGGMAPGDRALVEVRRGARFLSAEVELDEYDG